RILGMNLLRPRSLSALVLLGLAIIALPLVGALVTAGVQMRRLSETSERIIADGVVATRLTRDLFAQTSLLERQVELNAVMNDPRLLEPYARLDGRMSEIEAQLGGQLRLPEARQSLGEFTRLRSGVSAQMLNAATRTPEFAQLRADFGRMEQVASAMSAQ